MVVDNDDGVDGEVDRRLDHAALEVDQGAGFSSLIHKLPSALTQSLVQRPSTSSLFVHPFWQTSAVAPFGSMHEPSHQPFVTILVPRN